MSEQLQILIYEDAEKAVDARLDEGRETVCLTQRQMAELFNKDVRTINEHVPNVFDAGELVREPTIRNFRIVGQEGSRQVTRVLREHLTPDWKLHQQRSEANEQKFFCCCSAMTKDY